MRIAKWLAVPVCLGVLGVLGVLGTVTSPDGLRAREKKQPTPEERVAGEIASLRKRLATRHQAHARWLRSHKLRRSAHAHMMIALHFAPDSRSLRSSLGYRKDGDGWALRRPVDLATLENVAEPGMDAADRADEIRAFRIRELARIAEQARKLGLDDRSRELFEKLVRIDPRHDAARQALGHRRIGRCWFTPAEAVAVPEKIQITKVPGPSAVMHQVGETLTGWQCGRLFYESRGSKEDHHRALSAARRADGLCGTLFDDRARTSAIYPINVHDIGERAKFERYVDGQMLGPGRAAAAKQTGLVGGFPCWVYLRILRNDVDRTCDWWAHAVASYWLYAAAGGRIPAWALSGVSDYVSERVVGTMHTRFVVTEESAGVVWSAEKPSPRAWRRSLRVLAALGADPTCGTIFSSSLTGLTTADVAKSWSLVGFLVERDRAAFVRFLAQAATGKTIEALRKEYGLTPEGLDEIWRAFVIENG